MKRPFIVNTDDQQSFSPSAKQNIISPRIIKSVTKVVAVNRKMRALIDKIDYISQFDENVFIGGESGTGKSMLARRIHGNSPRSDKPFIEVSCATLSETLLESELFGHTKGAFTGAIQDRVGKLVEAQGGTFFLDDINSSSLRMQSKLLHVFEEMIIQPVGSNENIKLDVRFICASNKDLHEEVHNGRFREDLLYRAYIVNFVLPPLRDRKDDVIPLIQYFLNYFGRKYTKPKKGITEGSEMLALSYDWPGNVRELRNTVAGSVLLSEGEYVDLYLLNSSKTHRFIGDHSISKGTTLRESLAYYEKMILYNTLTELRWDYPGVCRKLGIGRSTLFNKIKKFGLEKRMKERVE